MTESPASRVSRRSAARSYRTGRMEGFSDGVFAFAITLLVLDLVIPEGTHDLLGGFLSVWPQYLTYVVSFATIGAAWLAHISITEQLERTDSTFLRLNLLVLLVVAFMPFPTRFLAEYIRSDQSERVAVVIYGLSFLCLVGMSLILWSYARSHRLLASGAAGGDGAMLMRRLLRGLVVYAVLIIIGVFVPMVSVFGYLVLALFFILPTRRIGRRHPDQPGS